MMATYYSSGGSEIQPAGGAVVAPGPPDSSNNLQTLYLMNPTFSSGGGGGGGGGRGTSYNHHPSSSSSSHDQQHHNQLPTNMFLLNSHDPSVVTSSSSSSPFSHTFHQQQHHHHLVGIPLATQSPHHHQDDHRPSPSSSSGGNIHEIPPTSLHGFLPRVHYNLWNSAATTVTTQLDPSSSSSPHHHIPTAIAMTTSSDGFRRPPPLTIQQHYQQQQQGLSLSLNNNNNSPNKITTIVQDPVGHHQTVSGMGLLPHHMGTIIPGDNSSTGPPASTSGMTNVVGGVGSLVLGSKYLKVTQELLDEVVNVETGVVVNDKVVVDSNNQKDKLVVMGIEGGETSLGGGGGVSQQQQQQELSTTQRQELQMKKAKLLNMLDEVEQRYRQYHTQMQIVVTSFEQTAGIGSARSYTALALQTISKQFRCLKDAITSQIKATSKTLGEDDGSYNSKGAAGGDGTHTTTTTTRLRFVDHQLRQQRALQQLGMVQHNAWRPQRGLPERAVSVLRAWLFEHFLHPYPKDSDKHMLAKQTGLTRSQVSNWFINARVRLWKPMVEEMYLEEVKTQEQNGTTTNNHRVNDQNNNPVTVATGANNINNNEHLDNNDHDSSSAINNRSSSSNPIHTHHTHPQQQPQVEKSTHILNHTNTLHDHHHNISNPPTMLSSPTQLGHHHHHLHHQSGGTSAALQNFSLIGTSSAPDMESILFRRSPKRQRSIDIHHNNNNSPTSIISMEMEMKSGGNQDHQPTQNHLFMTPAGGFGPFSTMSEIGTRSSFDPSDQQQLAAHQFMHGNGGVSLTLGLPHGENQLSPHHHHQQQLQHHNFIPTQNMQLGGRRVIDHHQIEQVGDHHHHHRAAAAAAAAEFCGITNSTQQPSSGTAGAYDGIDLQNRKRFAAAQLLPDFVIQQ